MKSFSLFIVLTISILVVSCGSKNEKIRKQLTTIEQNINGTNDAQKKDKFRDEYVQVANRFADQYPEDTLGAVYLYKAQSFQMEMLKTEEAQKTLLKIYKSYPNYSKRGDVTLDIAVSYDQMGNSKEAAVYYTNLIKGYPNHKNIKVAQDGLKLIQMLNNSGKSIEQMAAEFEKNKAQSDSLAKK